MYLLISSPGKFMDFVSFWLNSPRIFLFMLLYTVYMVLCDVFCNVFNLGVFGN